MGFRKMAAYKGGLYLAGSFPRDGVIKSGIWRYDSEDPTQKGELVVEIEDEWPVSQYNKGKGCMEIAYYDGMLYYNTPKAVWKWNFDKNTEPEKVFELEENVSGSIWYLHVADGKVYYETSLYEKNEKEKAGVCN